MLKLKQKSKLKVGVLKHQLHYLHNVCSDLAHTENSGLQYDSFLLTIEKTLKIIHDIEDIITHI